MPKNVTVQEIIDELIAIDPALRDREKELRPLVAEMLAAKPDVKVDERFKEELHAKVLKALEEKKTASGARGWFAPWILAAAGVGLAAFVIMVVKPGTPSGVPSVRSSVAVLAPGAFGDLASGTTAKGLGSDAARSAKPAFGLGGGGGGVPVSEPAAGGKMIAPGEWHPVFVKYSYAGEPLILDEKAVDVFRRVRGTRPPVPSSLLAAGPIDMTKFDGRIDNYSVVQDQEFGFIINVSATEDTVNIGQNWPRWPHPESACSDEACFAQYRMTPEQLPSDEEAIRIADAFLDTYGIDRGGYGSPVVQSDWRVMYEKAEDKRFTYVPESVGLSYPVLIEGMPAYDEGGNPAGMYVSVNGRNKKVDGVAGIAGRNYEKSSYPALASTEAVLDIVSRGGVYGPSQIGPDAEIVEATVGTPERVLMRMSTYDAASATSQELYVPALRFPVTSTTDRQDVYIPKAIVVPLAESLARPPDFPKPMPLIEAR